MNDMPSCSKVKLRKARKEHKCSNCQHGIKAGEEYIYISGVWDVPQDFKLCLNCNKIVSNFQIMDKNLDYDEGPSLGAFGVACWLADFMCKDWCGDQAKKDISKMFDVPMDYVNRIIK